MLKEICKNIFPAIFSTLFTGFYVIVDGFFIGQKSGELGLAAINIAWPIAAMIQSFGTAIGVASGIFISFYRAKGEEEKIKKVLFNTLILIIILELISLSILIYKRPLLFLLGATNETIELANDYIMVYVIGSILEIMGCLMVPLSRNFGHFRIAAIGLIIATAVNFVLDYLLIYLADLELVGASLASVFAEGLVATILLTFLILKRKIKFKFEVDKKVLLTIFLKSLAPFILAYSASLLIVVYNRFALAYGSNEAVAAYTVVAYVVFIPQYIAIGVSDGIQPVLTYHYGLKDKNLNKYFYYTFLILEILLSLTTLPFLFLKENMADMFNIDGLARTIYYNSYYYFVASFLFIGVIRIYAARFYSIEQSTKADLIVLLEPVITPIILLILTKIMGIDGIWLGFLVIQILLALLSFLITKVRIKQLAQIQIENL